MGMAREIERLRAAMGSVTRGKAETTIPDMRIKRLLPDGQAVCGWPDCCGGDPRSCWQPGQEAERAAFEGWIKRIALNPRTESDGGECQMMADYRWACDEIERLRAAMQAAYDVLHDDNDAAGAEIVLRVALQGSANRDI